ncbi:tetratricopeptide repeat protein [Bradyrhizobium sp.]|uniref:tetratricopeptide repeat protein n=1 Tax=Bradyrhizobium sp. TaxID=376 RepID=UPI002734DEF1|nr:tetratricopeptide repeat protein [Bradyrhizobium sp.]MDP3076052.1 tetratricopeptide repeat protein [Bradyrhizobium sp.]
MALIAATGFWSRGRACARTARLCLGSWLVLIGLTSTAFSQTEPVRGEATFSASGGYARLVLKLAEDVESQVSTAGSILVIRFKRPVDIPVDRLSDAVPDYVGSVRRDPDGSAIRLSLSRKVTVNTMTAGERVFVDLLPDTWSGQPPALPAEVVRELSERARVAERALRQQRAAAAAQKRPPIRVRASVQPTFVRFVFEMPDGISVSSVLNDQRLSLLFNAALSFDLADAKLALPSNIASIGQKIERETSMVEVVLIGDVDVRSFREEKNYIIDVAFQQADKAQRSPVADVLQAPAAAAAPARPAAPSASRAGNVIAPPTSETFAQQANIEIKPEQAAKIAPASEPLPARETPRQAPAVMAEAPSKLTAAAAAPPEPGAQKVAQTSPAIVSPPANVSPPVIDAPPAIPAQPVPQGLPPAAQAPSAAQAMPAGAGPATVTARRDSDALRVTFAFAAATPAALFRRADTVWLVFDSQQPIDSDLIRSSGGALISDVSRLTLDKGQAIRIRLNRPQMPSLTGDDKGGAHWMLTFADTMQSPQLPLAVIRNITDPALANVTVPLSRPGLLHRFIDPEAGDTLLVVTASLPVRGLIKRHDFVEMSLLESIHGVAVHPVSEDVVAEVAPDRVIIGRPGGLTLSSADVASERATTAVRPIFDIAEWRRNQAENFIARQDELIAAAGAMEPAQRTQARINLARFLMSRGMYWEAKGAADLALADAKPGSEDSIALMVRVVANILIGRPEQALKDLANPVIGASYDSQLWKALAFSRQGKWAEAREKFKNVEFAITSLPIELQRSVISEAMRASLEVRDFSGAAKRGSDLKVVGVPTEMKAATAVLFGRLAEALGHDKDAQSEYKVAIESPDRAAAAEARLLDIILRQRREETSQADSLRELETLAVLWRGDAIEVRALQMMAKIYADTGRYGESLAAARAATRLQPNSEISRAGQDASAALFAQIYLSPKGDNLPPVDALGMFYEYSELTPIGRRGDEMIRRLADRLVAVDLLDQAAELLQYQVDRRLEGAARAQVAARLAMVYLTGRKPDRAISALRTTRIADLSGELRQQRLLLESRAQSDVGRHDLALDIISNIGGREAIRLRSDIYWASRRWRESAEQIELYYADRWRDFRPLDTVEKGDVIRAVVGYALAEDAIGLARFREKYAPLMSGEADRAAFETAGNSSGASSAEFATIARMAASVDTLDGFLREMKVRFPDATARAPLSPETAKGEPVHTGSLPRIIGLTRSDAKR